MVFNSIEFLIFFPLVLGVYFLINHKYRWLWLLLASSFFYMFFKAIYVLILFGTIIIDFYAGVAIENSKSKKAKRSLLILSLVANIGVLAVFKYYNFINENMTVLLQGLGLSNPIPFLNILLPIGLSFHTFQAMSYTIEVYRGNQKAERKLGIYALYVMFFPQLVAGPIERPQNLLHQFHEVKTFNIGSLVIGLRLIFWGLFKKMVIADNIAPYVDVVFHDVKSQSALSCMIAAYLFSFQIYCDFSGYSDIAIGTAKTMGFELMKNFNLPYLSKSVREFWGRWHISLSTWFKDYLYIPLGGNRKGTKRMLFNLMIVFIISGIWHGASYTFIIWGAIHGLFLVMGVLLFERNSVIDRIKKADYVNRFYSIISVIITFHLTTLAWIYFRSDSITTANSIIYKIFIGITDINKQDKLHENTDLFHSTGVHEIYCILLLVILFYILDWMKELLFIKKYFHQNLYVRIFTYVFLFVTVFFYGFIEKTSFIYFQF